jgi:hypothetical protein
MTPSSSGSSRLRASPASSVASTISGSCFAASTRIDCWASPSSSRSSCNTSALAAALPAAL